MTASRAILATIAVDLGSMHDQPEAQVIGPGRYLTERVWLDPNAGSHRQAPIVTVEQHDAVAATGDAHHPLEQVLDAVLDTLAREAGRRKRRRRAAEEPLGRAQLLVSRDIRGNHEPPSSATFGEV